MNASAPGESTRGSDWWAARVARLRQGRQAGPTEGGHTYESAWAELHEATLERARKRFASFRRSLREDFEDVLRDGLDGDHERPGIFASLEALPSPPISPCAWLLRCLQNRLLDAAESARRLTPFDPPGAAGEESRERQLAAPPSATPGCARPGLDQAPRAVRRTLTDAQEIAAVVLELLPRLPAGHPLGALLPQAPQLTRRAALWGRLAGYLGRDLELWLARLHWTYGAAEVATDDNFERAWLATYFQFEEAPEFLGPDEIPADKHGKRGQLFYKHKQRFKDEFQEAARCTLAAVAGADGATREAARGAAARQRIPTEWDAAEHQTLQRAEDR